MIYLNIYFMDWLKITYNFVQMYTLSRWCILMTFFISSLKYFHNLLERLLWNLVDIFMIPRGWIGVTLIRCGSSAQSLWSAGLEKSCHHHSPLRCPWARSLNPTAPVELLSGQQTRLCLYWTASGCECGLNILHKQKQQQQIQSF